MFKLPPLFHYQMYPRALAAELLAMGERVGKPYMALVPAAILIGSSWKLIPLHVICFWLIMVMVVAAFGSWYNHRYRGLDPQTATLAEIRRAEHIATVYSACLGTTWGSISLMMVPGALEHNFLVVIIFFGVGAGGAAIGVFNRALMLASNLTGTIAFLLPIREAFPNDWPWMILMVLLFNAIMVNTTWQRTQIIIQNLLLRDDKQRLLEKQEAETERANQANREKSAFLAAASHDLRQPLHALMLTSHALSLRTPQGENRELVQRIVEAGGALSDQFNHLMDLSRLESGVYRLQSSLAPIAGLLAQTVASHQQFAEHKGIVLRQRLGWRLRDAGVVLDAGLLRRILDNLVHNAIKFSGRGGRVLLSARLRQGCVVFSVHDRGAGIPPEQRENIFKPYVQLGNPTRDMRRGIGLGLSIVQQAAELLDARLDLRSQPGRGSAFTLTLASRALQQLPPVSSGGADTAKLPVHRLRGKRLLIVEDDPMAAAALITWAQDWGLQVQHHPDPREVAADAQPDLILSDIRLPGERDGIDWVAEWLGWWPEARALLLSGEISPETHQRAEQEGLLLLAKPVPPDFLLQTLVGLVP